ncbi:MAG: hypothetical protein DRP74_05130 [Candidatus Omnitrophota bacterium]|nr:MAG: hypothetical protein DRP74_05130 [Candidatus Omnitrophota bacterium]
MKERRDFLRLDLREMLNLSPKDSPSLRLKCKTIDISYRGIGLYSDKRLEPKNKVDFELKTKLWDKPVTGSAKIAHVNLEKRPNCSNLFRMGIEFTQINKSTVIFILNRIQNNICRQIKQRQLNKPSS